MHCVQPSLFSLIEKWLERTPLVSTNSGFEFWNTYRASVRSMFEREREVVTKRHDLTDVQKTDLYSKVRDSLNEQMNGLVSSFVLINEFCALQ
jgi:hypothetical protein